MELGVVLAIVFGAAVAAGALRGLTSRRLDDHPVPPAGAQTRRIRVKGRYQPSEVHVDAGRPIRLLVRRDETAACSARIVFPDFGLSVDLPAFAEVAIDLPAREAGDYRFCCQMDMLQGRLVVDPVGELSAGAEQAVSA